MKEKKVYKIFVKLAGYNYTMNECFNTETEARKVARSVIKRKGTFCIREFKRN